MHLHMKSDALRPNHYYFGPIAEAITGAINGAASVGMGIYNAYQQKKAFDYNKELNETLMEREDSAFQRAVADAQKAGLSPLVAANSPAGSGGTVSSLQAPQLDASTFQDGLRALQDAASHATDIKATHTEAEANRQSQHDDLKMQLESVESNLEKQLSADAALQSERLQANATEAEKDRANQRQMQQAQLLQNQKQFDKNLQFQLTERNKDRKHEYSKDGLQNILKINPSQKTFSCSGDQAKFDAALEKYASFYAECSRQAMEMSGTHSETVGSNTNGDVDSGFDVGVASASTSLHGENTSQTTDTTGQTYEQILQSLLNAPGAPEYPVLY